MTEINKPRQGSKLSNLPLDASSASETKINKPRLVEGVRDISDERCGQLLCYVTVIVDPNPNNPATYGLAENAPCDFFVPGRRKGAKVVKQVISGFTPFSAFDSVESEKSQHRQESPGRPKLISDYGVHDV